MTARWNSTSSEALRRYNALDCIVTARVWAAMHKELGDDERARALYRHQFTLSQVAAEMHTNGIRVDRRRQRELANELAALYQTRKRRFLRKVRMRGFRGTPDEMRSLIFRRHATKAVARYNLEDPLDKTGWADEAHTKCAVDINAMLLLMADPYCPEDLKEVIEAYWQMNAARKARSTYVVSEKVLHAIGPDNRLRPGWNSCGADTGRWACSEPNVMNLSEKKEEDTGATQGDMPNIRSMYRVERGCRLVYADWSQLELNIMAAVSGDEVLDANLATGDVYSVDARDWFSLPPDMDVKKLKPAARKQAKVIHLGKQYGAGIAAVYQQALRQDRTMKFQTADLLCKAFDKTYAGTLRYWGEEMQRVMECGYSESRIMHRRRYYPREPPPTEVNNYPIQSTAADAANVAIIDLRRALKSVPGAKLILQLHDALGVECPRRSVPAVRDAVLAAMEQPFEIQGKQRVFKVEMKEGERWSDV